MMAPSHVHVKSLSGTVFNTVLWFCLITVFLFSVLATALLYGAYEAEAEKNIITRTQSMATSLSQLASDNDGRISVLQQQIDSPTRITLIDSEGVVLFDSSGNQLGNHADRPEFQQAEQYGEAISNRYSETLQTDMLYCAVRLDDGSTLRLAETRSSLFSFFVAVAFPIIALLGAVIVAVAILSRVLTKRILAPIDALDFKDPLHNEIYEEMDPLLVRIDDQQEQLRQQNKELARADNMRREFSANVSHEMKTPLTVISGYAELLKNDMVKPEDRQRFATLIYNESQVLRALINDVLTISRLDETSVDREDGPVDLFTISQTVIHRLTSVAEEKGIHLELVGSPVSILGTESTCEQMIYNLVDNGIRYTGENGRVRVECGTDEEGRRFVSVSDNGIGVAPKYQDKIFERFFRVDKSRSKETGGTGLGLAIVKHAVQYQGGTIEVRSIEGTGTTFVLLFPDMESRRRTLDRMKTTD